MTDQQIENVIREAEQQAENSSFIAARLMGLFTLLLVPFIFFSVIGLLVAVWVAVGTIVTGSLWLQGRKFKQELTQEWARAVWQRINWKDVQGKKFSLTEGKSLKESKLVKDIARVYDGDPQGLLLPLPQAIRLVVAWKNQQERIQLVNTHIKQLKTTRASLLDKDRQLRELGDSDKSVEKAIDQLNDDIAPLEKSCDVLRASISRLEALVIGLDATARRRQLHREVSEITARLPIGADKSSDSFDEVDEHIDLERQIGREIETYRKLEIETNAHLRDL